MKNNNNKVINKGKYIYNSLLLSFYHYLNNIITIYIYIFIYIKYRGKW